MSESKGYGQFCPIAVAAEVIAERWTPLVIRSLICGAHRFNDIQAGVPRMSSALLSRRLKELEYAGVITREPARSGRGYEYFLTDSGREVLPILEAMGVWAQKWLRRDIVEDRNLDPDVFFWELRRFALSQGHRVERRKVVEFRLEGVSADRRFFWLVFEPDDSVDVCVKDPGYEVDLWVTAALRTLVEVWLGHRPLTGALDDDSLRLDGSRQDIQDFRRWFVRSRFAPAGELPPAEAAE